MFTLFCKKIKTPAPLWDKSYSCGTTQIRPKTLSYTYYVQSAVTGSPRLSYSFSFGSPSRVHSPYFPPPCFHHPQLSIRFPYAYSLSVIGFTFYQYSIHLRKCQYFFATKNGKMVSILPFRFILRLWYRLTPRDQCRWVAIPIQPLHFHLVLKHRQVRTNHKTAPRSRTVPG